MQFKSGSFEVQKQSVSNAFQYVVHYLSQIVMWQTNGNVATKLQRFFEFHPYLVAKFPPFPPTKSEGAIRGVSPSVSYIIINLPYREKQNYNLTVLTVLQLLFLIPCFYSNFGSTSLVVKWSKEKLKGVKRRYHVRQHKLKGHLHLYRCPLLMRLNDYATSACTDSTSNGAEDSNGKLDNGVPLWLCFWFHKFLSF